MEIRFFGSVVLRFFGGYGLVGKDCLLFGFLEL